jgi:hypothetical protein
VTRALTTYERRYLPGGAVRHLLRAATDAAAVCGIGPWTYADWHGTGSQSEYEMTESLPDCKLCLRRLR